MRFGSPPIAFLDELEWLGRHERFSFLLFWSLVESFIERDWWSNYCSPTAREPTKSSMLSSYCQKCLWGVRCENPLSLPSFIFLSMSLLYHQKVNFGWLWGLRSLPSYSLKYSILAMSSTPFEMEGCRGDGVCLLQVHDFVFLLPIVYPLTPPWNLIILAPHHKILGCWFTSLIKHNENYELSWRLH